MTRYEQLKEIADCKVDACNFIDLAQFLEWIDDEPKCEHGDPERYRPYIYQEYPDDPIRAAAVFQRVCCMHRMFRHPDAEAYTKDSSIRHIAYSYAAATAKLHIYGDSFRFHSHEFFGIAKGYKRPEPNKQAG